MKAADRLPPAASDVVQAALEEGIRTKARPKSSGLRALAAALGVSPDDNLTTKQLLKQAAAKLAAKQTSPPDVAKAATASPAQLPEEDSPTSPAEEAPSSAATQLMHLLQS